MAPAPRTEPQASYKNAVVLYYWTQCGYCKQFAPVFEDVVAELPDGVKVYEIEVQTHKQALEKYGVDLGSGVPRLEFFDADGNVFVYDGKREKTPVLAAILDHLHVAPPSPAAAFPASPLGGGGGGRRVSATQYSNELQYLLSLIRSKQLEEQREEEDEEEEQRDEETISSLNSALSQRTDEKNDDVGGDEGGDEHDGDLTSILVSPDAIRAPALVLYFTQRCPHCVAFKPTFKQLVNHAAIPEDVMVCAVDVQTNQGALQKLQPQARSGGVPHVVMVSRSNYQTPFAAKRTVEDLLEFIESAVDAEGGERMEKEDGEDELEGGGSRKLKFGDKPQKTTMRRMLSDALDSLQEQAAAELGEVNRELFEKKHSAVCYVAWRCSSKKNNPGSDQMYLILIPRSRRIRRESEVGVVSSVAAEFPVFAVIHGKRKGPLSSRIFMDHNPVSLVKQKARAGYQKARETDVVSQAMHDMGYTVRIDYGPNVVHI